MAGRADDDWLADVGERLPVSPLSVLGSGLAALVALRSVADPAPLGRDVVAAVVPMAASLGSVAADRWLLHDGVSIRDRITVFSFALGGFLTAAVITGLQLLLLRLEGALVARPLYLILVGGAVGVAAGTVAGTAEIRQREAAREARRQRERLEQFASVVSHDLRSPLEVAQGYLDSAFESGDPDHLLRVRKALERMDDIIEESLALARKGQLVDDPDPTDVAATAEAARESVETGGATVAVETDLVVAADEGRLRELFENLFRNAVEHGSTSPPSQARRDAAGTSSGEPSVADAPEDTVEHGVPEADGDGAPESDGPNDASPLRVRVGTIGDGEGFFVADDGQGIPPERRDEVFEEGHTTATDGTGLGLAIVREIAEAHGWSVAATESESGGARFEVRT